ncbi:MAG: hypothetical protein J2P46_01265 [Zavarzinella sp.]|nr:hypothetical protein [Zavarzinella sp.]
MAREARYGISHRPERVRDDPANDTHLRPVWPVPGEAEQFDRHRRSARG